MGSRSSVRVVESCLVPPSAETPRKALWLSALDLVLANRGYTPLVHIYSAGDLADAAGDDFFNVSKLKKSMAKALVPFYPLAGRLSTDSDGRIEVNCNAEGALFVVAHSDRTVEDFSDSPELRKLLCPRVQQSSVILAAQVTFLSCGGAVVGTAGHHAVVDGASMFHFIRTWARYCREGERASIEPPCHDRGLLRARSPPVIRPETVPMFCSRLAMQEPSATSTVATKVFPFSRNQLRALKRQCGGASTFCAVSALVWRCVCVARGLDPDAVTRMNFPVDVRRRLDPPLPDGYFGNGVVNVFATAAVRDVVSETLASVASRIKDTTERFDDGLLRSAVEYFEMEAEKGGRPEHSGNLPETELRMNSWYHLRTYEADFGWGKPRVMTRAEAVRGGWVYLLDAGRGDGSAHLLVSLEAATLEKFQRAIATCGVSGSARARL